MMKRFFYFIYLLLFSISANANDLSPAIDNFEQGNAAYKTGDYIMAIQYYEQAAKDAMGLELYYNLGNAYFKTTQLPQAILNYERALKFDPGNADVLHNLTLANEAVVDEIEAMPASPISNWWNELKFGLGPDTWAWMAIGFMAFAIVLFAIYYISSTTALRRFSFFSGLILFLFSFIFLILGAANKTYLEKNHEAIIFSAKVDARSEPNLNSSTVFTLHEGSKIQILTKSEEWFEIEIASGNKGWIKKENAEEI